VKRRQFLAAGLPAFLLPAARSLHAGQMRTFKRENVLGTSFELKVFATSEAASSQAEAAAIGEIGRQDAILSSWRPDSEFSRWFLTSGEAVRVSPELFEVLSTFDAWRARTDGAIDAAAEVVTRTWTAAARQGRMPASDELVRAVAAVRQPHWKLNPATRTATHLSDTPLATNSFVKSFIMGRAVDAALSTPGISGAVMNVGGDLVIRGAWTEPVQIADPRSDEENDAPIARLLVADRAVATSGGYRRGFDIAGRHYSHIVDPRTGDCASYILSATVIAPNPADAGALATAFCMLTPQQSARLSATSPGVDYHLVTADGQRLSSAGWHHYEASTPLLFAAAKPEPVPAPMPQAAESGMELGISFQIAQQAGFGKRPYAAVWIEDKDHFPVRTLALWYEKDRWLPELRNWYRDDRMRAMAEGSDIAASVASATRPPGKYTLKWDGKDHTGKPVKLGKYTVLIEAAREHGTYQIMRQEIDFNGKPQQFQIPGNQEIASATIDYRKAAR
jgi:thiamine biosynthesis lipoprotein